MYAIYLNDIERFIALEKDLWIAHLAAKLLSSKLSICICDIGDQLGIDNDNCFLWSMSTPELPLSTQYPRLILPSNPVVEYKGSPINVDLSMLKRHQSFCLFVLRSVYALKMTDALLNTSDRSYFKFLLEISDINSLPDDSGADKGFVPSIERILYLARDKEQALAEFNKVFANPESIFPRNLLQYKTTFYRYLND